MADTITLEQVLLDMADCQGNQGVGHTYSRLTSWRLAIDAAIKQREQDADVCVWSEDEDGNWDTGCGNMFVLTEGTPYDNEMGFCCYCGHKLDQETQENAAMVKESGNG